MVIIFVFFQILRGSQKCGRVEHLMVAGQTGADIERVKEIEKVCPMEYVEMEPGTCNKARKSSHPLTISKSIYAPFSIFLKFHSFIYTY